MTQASTLTSHSLGAQATDAKTPALGLRRAAVRSRCCYEVTEQNRAGRPEGKQKQTMGLSVGTPSDEDHSGKAP